MNIWTRLAELRERLISARSMGEAKATKKHWAQENRRAGRKIRVHRIDGSPFTTKSHATRRAHRRRRSQMAAASRRRNRP